MFAVMFMIATLLINRAFNAQLDRDVIELRSNISRVYQLFLNTIREEVQAKGEARDVRYAVQSPESGGSTFIRAPNFDVFECGNADGTLVLSQRIDEPGIGITNLELVNAKTDEDFKEGKGTIRERIIETGDEPQLVVEVTQWLEWGFVTGGKSLQKWLEGALLSQPAEHPIFLVRRKNEQEEWIPLNYIAGQTTILKDEWEQQMQANEAERKTSGGVGGRVKG